MEQVLENAVISILSNFLSIFPNFFPIFRNFAKCYPHAKFQINWTIQTEITESVPPGNTNLQKARPGVTLQSTAGNTIMTLTGKVSGQKPPGQKPPGHKPPDKKPLDKNSPCQKPPGQKPPRENL